MPVVFHNGEIVDSATSVTDVVRVSVPNLNMLGRVTYGPMSFHPMVVAGGNIEYPVRGDKALIAIDSEGGVPWVVEWHRSIPGALGVDMATQAELDVTDARVDALEISHGCIIHTNQTQTVASAAIEVVTFQTEIYDPHGMHSAAASPTDPNNKMIVVDRDGVWMVSMRASINVTPNGASTWAANVLVNAVGLTHAPGGSELMWNIGFNYYVCDTAPLVLNAGDKLTLSVTQNGGTTGTIIAPTRLAAFYRGLDV